MRKVLKSAPATTAKAGAGIAVSASGVVSLARPIGIPSEFWIIPKIPIASNVGDGLALPYSTTAAYTEPAIAEYATLTAAGTVLGADIRRTLPFANMASIQHAYFVAYLSTSTNNAGDTVQAELFDYTATAAIAGSGVSAVSLAAGTVETAYSADIAAALPAANHLMGVKVQNASTAVHGALITGAVLIVVF